MDIILCLLGLAGIFVGFGEGVCWKRMTLAVVGTKLSRA